MRGSRQGIGSRRCVARPESDRASSAASKDTRPSGVPAGSAREGSSAWFALKVVATIREVEALIAQREVGNLLPAQCHREARPVVERRVDDLVSGEAPLSVGQTP